MASPSDDVISLQGSNLQPPEREGFKAPQPAGENPTRRCDGRQPVNASSAVHPPVPRRFHGDGWTFHPQESSSEMDPRAV